MQKILVVLTIVSLVFTVSSWADGKLAPELQKALRESEDGEIDVIVRYKKQNNVSQLVSDLKQSARDQQELGERLRERMRERAGRDQKNLKNVIEKMKREKKVKRTGEEFWLVNAETIRVDRKALRELQNNPDVDEIFLDELKVLIEPVNVRNEDSRKKGKGKGRELKPGKEEEVSALAGPVPLFSTFDIYGKEITEVNKVHQLTVNGVPLKGAGIKVAVLDTGIDPTHSEFRAGQVQAGASFISAEPNSLQDLNNHGTHCAGTIGSRTFGMAPDCTLVAVKVLSGAGSGSTSGIAQGIQFCVGQGIRVLSLSLGGPDTRGIDIGEQAIRNAIAANVICIVANGNSGPGTATAGSPAALPECIAVGAMNQLGELASFSSRGPTADGLAKPDLCGPGVSIKSTIPGNRTAFFSGTSMATPHVAGIVALLLQAKSAQTPAQIKQVLLSTTTGNEVVNETGKGLVNALKAINVVLPVAPTPPPTPQPSAADFAQNKLITDLSRELGAIFGSRASNFRFSLTEAPIINQSTRTAIVRLRCQSLRTGRITTVRVDMVLQLVGTVFTWVVTPQSRTLLQNVAAQG